MTVPSTDAAVAEPAGAAGGAPKDGGAGAAPAAPAAPPPTDLRLLIPGWPLAPDGALERLDVDLLVRAYRFSDEAHEGQTRKSGEKYVTHCIVVASILAELGLDSVTVASGLIHDVVEDTTITVADVEREFGREVAQIVDGLT